MGERFFEPAELFEHLGQQLVHHQLLFLEPVPTGELGGALQYRHCLDQFTVGDADTATSHPHRNEDRRLRRLGLSLGAGQRCIGFVETGLGPW
jgi:hypothetical protein